jgi:hypothetical protein
LADNSGVPGRMATGVTMAVAGSTLRTRRQNQDLACEPVTQWRMIENPTLGSSDNALDLSASVRL